MAKIGPKTPNVSTPISGAAEVATEAPAPVSTPAVSSPSFDPKVSVAAKRPPVLTPTNRST